MPPRSAPTPDRRRRLERHALPAAAVALAALVAGVVVGANHVPGEQRVVERFAAAWRHNDYAGMQAELGDAQRRTLSAATLGQAYRIAMDTGSVRSYVIGKPRKAGDHAYALPVTAHTAAFGDVRGTVRLPLEGSGDGARIRWAINLTFPNVPTGERLERHPQLAPRATLEARDGTVLAKGADRSSPISTLASSVVGEVGPIPAAEADAYRRAGYPSDAKVGISGLEKIFERRLAGQPGGSLTAGGVTLARRSPEQGAAVRTTISPRVQQAAVDALAGRLGGVVALQPRTGQILAAAGIPFSGLQPPGSTFKMITLTAALQYHAARPTTVFPYATSATLSGVTLGNANGESCGGTLRQAFAVSCNSVFAPLGAKVGAARLVATAERFGFNRPSPIPGAAESTIPPASEIGDDLAVGSSAIGQGRVQASTLQMATVAAAIALHGRLPALTLTYPEHGASPPPGAQATTPAVARQVRRMMVEVVRNGTGVQAAIPGVTVAGKTGTAELRSTQGCTPQPDNPESCAGQSAHDDTTDTDAWFAAFAPALSPRVVVGVLLVADGAGGDTAAPAARSVIETALGR